MALIKCPDCGKDISDLAPACIGCGRTMQILHNRQDIKRGIRKELEVTWNRALTVWWSLAWRGLLFGLLAGFLAGFIIGFFGLLLGIDKGLIHSLCIFAGAVLSIPVGMWVVRVVLRKKFSEFHIALVEDSLVGKGLTTTVINEVTTPSVGGLDGSEGRLEPDDTGAPNNLGLTYAKPHRKQESVDALKQAIRLKPNDANAHNSLGVTYGNLGRYQEAVDTLKQAIRLEPDYAEAHYNLGVAYGNLGRYQEAVEACKEAIRLEPNYAEAHYNLGVSYVLLDNKGSAVEEYKILKNLDQERANELFNLIYK